MRPASTSTPQRFYPRKYPKYHFRLEFDILMKQLLPLSIITFPVVINYRHFYHNVLRSDQLLTLSITTVLGNPGVTHYVLTSFKNDDDWITPGSPRMYYNVPICDQLLPLSITTFSVMISFCHCLLQRSQ